MIQIEKLVFIDRLTYDVSLTDARLSNLFIKIFIFNRMTIANVNSYDVAS